MNNPIPGELAGHAVGERIGLGAMGLVVRGQHIALGRDVAIKFRFRETRADEDLFAERFRQGAIRQAELTHPGIAQLYDFVEADDFQAIIMEYLDGGSVESWLRKEGMLPISAALEIAIRVCDAMAYAHEFGVVHRDIKPANLMLAHPRSAETVQVTDFGVAKAPDRSPDITVIGASVGTIWYMPPEQLSSHGIVDPRVDVYAIGATLYEMLCGHVPFAVPEAPEVFRRFLDGEPLPPLEKRNPAVPRTIVAITSAALELDVEQRIPSAAALGALLRSAAHLEGLIYPATLEEMSREAARDACIGRAIELLPDDVRTDIAFGVRTTESERGTPTQSIDAVNVGGLDLSSTNHELESIDGRQFTALNVGPSTNDWPHDRATDLIRSVAEPGQAFDEDDECTIITVLEIPDEDEP